MSDERNDRNRARVDAAIAAAARAAAPATLARRVRAAIDPEPRRLHGAARWAPRAAAAALLVAAAAWWIGRPASQPTPRPAQAAARAPEAVPKPAREAPPLSPQAESPQAESRPVVVRAARTRPAGPPAQATTRDDRALPPLPVPPSVAPGRLAQTDIQPVPLGVAPLRELSPAQVAALPLDDARADGRAGDDR